MCQIRARVRVEAEYFALLAERGVLGVDSAKELAEAARALPDTFGAAACARVKELERETNHDVKAVEYWLVCCNELFYF